jgi:hypothetical protein
MYNEKSFSGCLFNPMVSDKMLTAYPKLSEIILPEWACDPMLDTLLRYMALMYDPKSPLVINERDLNFRKGEAATIAQIDNNELKEQIFDFSHDYFLELLMRYLTRFVKSKEFSALMVVENCYWESVKQLFKPIDGKNSKEELDAVQKKSVIKDELDKDMDRLDRLYSSFLGEDELLKAKVKTRSTPEARAKLRA